jgi:hypothetical protein
LAQLGWALLLHGRMLLHLHLALSCSALPTPACPPCLPLPAGLKSRFYGLDDEQCSVEELALQVGARELFVGCFQITPSGCD